MKLLRRDGQDDCIAERVDFVSSNSQSARIIKHRVKTGVHAIEIPYWGFIIGLDQSSVSKTYWLISSEMDREIHTFAIET